MFGQFGPFFACYFFFFLTFSFISKNTDKGMNMNVGMFLLLLCFPVFSFEIFSIFFQFKAALRKISFLNKKNETMKNAWTKKFKISSRRYSSVQFLEDQMGGLSLSFYHFVCVYVSLHSIIFLFASYSYGLVILNLELPSSS